MRKPTIPAAMLASQCVFVSTGILDGEESNRVSSNMDATSCSDWPRPQALDPSQRSNDGRLQARAHKLWTSHLPGHVRFAVANRPGPGWQLLSTNRCRL